jgi:hypothetical protein
MTGTTTLTSATSTGRLTRSQQRTLDAAGQPDGEGPPDDEDPPDDQDYPPRRPPPGRAGGNPGGDPDGGNDDDEEEDPAARRARRRELTELAAAISAALAQQPSEKAHVKDPERFSGKDATKLRTFLTSCELVFRSQPRTYASDDRKIVYAASYLTDLAAAWFQPHLLTPTDPIPLFVQDWDYFKAELEGNFGEVDPEATAEHQIRRLRMAENHRCVRYTVEFMALATQMNWDDRALLSQYYEGLAERLKDRIMDRPGGKPPTFGLLRRIAQEMDALYWQRHEEKVRLRPSHSSSDRPDKEKSTTTRVSTTTMNVQSTSGGTSSRRSTPNPTVPKHSGTSNKPDLTGKLTSDNKLTSAERARRLLEKLCLYCGKQGHSASDCRLAAANKKQREEAAAKARAAKTTAPTSADPPAKSEN